MLPFQLHRLGVIMEPKDGEPSEIEGVLNPAAARGRDGQLYLFPRLVGRGNYSRIGVARVVFDKVGEPAGVERMGIALEPAAPYERRPDGSGGCEDPRITFFEPSNEYIMTYTALSANGPRIAIARSFDLMTWTRVGLMKFPPFEGVELANIEDKDCVIFPSFLADPLAVPSVVLLHRPLLPEAQPEELAGIPAPIVPVHESIWMSYLRLTPKERSVQYATGFVSHRLLARPQAPWERLKIGAGTPPVLCRHGWLLLYHGVHELPGSTSARRKLCYSAGVMILAQNEPHKILYRSAEPVLSPERDLELKGTVDNVVFPTGIDRRDDLGTPERLDVYYGMADDRIGVARMTVPSELPAPSII